MSSYSGTELIHVNNHGIVHFGERFEGGSVLFTGFSSGYSFHGCTFSGILLCFESNGMGIFAFRRCIFINCRLIFEDNHHGTAYIIESCQFLNSALSGCPPDINGDFNNYDPSNLIEPAPLIFVVTSSQFFSTYVVPFSVGTLEDTPYDFVFNYVECVEDNINHTSAGCVFQYCFFVRVDDNGAEISLPGLSVLD